MLEISAVDLILAITEAKEPNIWSFVITFIVALGSAILGAWLGGVFTRKAAKEGAKEAHTLLEKTEGSRLKQEGEVSFTVLMSIIESIRKNFNEVSRYTGQRRIDEAPLISNDILIELIPKVAHWNVEASIKIARGMSIINNYNIFIKSMKREKLTNSNDWDGYYKGMQKYFNDFRQLYEELEQIWNKIKH
jgi:hypothetical protein